MQYFGHAEKQVVPPSVHEGGQSAEVVGVLMLNVLVDSTSDTHSFQLCASQRTPSGSEHADGPTWNAVSVFNTVAVRMRTALTFCGKSLFAFLAHARCC